MDNDMPAGETPEAVDSSGPGLPKNSSLATVPKQVPAVADPEERNGVFRQLVTDDADIAGLVAYSIYKQNKLDWLTAFEKMRGKSPNPDELASYIIGEGTPRRIATYRHLAEATLAGNGPEVGGSVTPRRIGSLAENRSMTNGWIAAYALIAVLFVVGFLLAAHYTMTSR